MHEFAMSKMRLMNDRNFSLQASKRREEFFIRYHRGIRSSCESTKQFIVTFTA